MTVYEHLLTWPRKIPDDALHISFPSLHAGSKFVGLFQAAHATISTGRTTVSNARKELMNGFGTVVGSCHHTLDTFKQRLLNKQAEQRLALQTKTTGRIENSHNHLKHPISFTNTYIKGPSPFGIPRLRDMAM